MPQFGLGRPGTQAEALADRDLQAEIGGRPDIGTSERKDQVDLGAPPPDALECEQPGQRGLVIGLGETEKSNSPPAAFSARWRA